ncbi:nuclear transport factor 2 family protein, partial [Trinickia symbiotica]
MTNMPSTAVQQASQIASRWLELFNAALSTRNPTRLNALFHPDSHWRDLLALTWTFDTVSGRDSLSSALLEAASRCGARNFEIDPRRCAPREVERAGEL